MENKNHGVIAERVLEKEEAKELSRAKDKETKSEIRGKLADVADEIWDAAMKFILNTEEKVEVGILKVFIGNQLLCVRGALMLEDIYMQTLRL